MVADDEAPVREVLRDLILALGNDYVVYSAADSFEALRMLQSLPLDLVLIDIFMPGLNGLELLKQAREQYPNVMMVIITGQPSYNMVLESLRLGATDFLAKPISLAELRKILAKLKEQPKHSATPKLEIEPTLGPLDQEISGKIQGRHFLDSLSEQLGMIQRARDLYPFLTTMAQTLTGGAQVAFYLYNQEMGRFQLVSWTDRETGAAVAPLDPLPNTDDDASRSFSEADLHRQQSSAPTCLSLPLQLRDNFLGVLHVYGRPGHNFDPDIQHRLNVLVDRALLTLENLTLHENAFYNLYDTLKALINSLEARDPCSRHHSVRVTRIATHFAEALGLSRELVDSLNLAGALHDIGKIGIPDAILFKPSSLTTREIEIIRQHSAIGENIVAPLNLHPRERALILHHHERWDGKGYPMGLKGEDIPFLSRIIALADSYDAITSDRPYRQRRTHEEALADITVHAGTQFDPELARQFINIMGSSLIIQKICGAAANLETGQPCLSGQQFKLLKKNLHHKLLHPSAPKKTPLVYSSQ